jgi:hypothetical protein
MERLVGVGFDPETVELLRTAVDAAWDALTPSRKQTVLRSELAQRILVAAGQGERDPDRLRTIALLRPSIEVTLQPSQDAPIL